MKNKLYILICFTFSIHSLMSFDQHKFFSIKDKESQFMFLEKHFITDVYEAKHQIWDHIKMIIPGLCACIAAYQYLNAPGQSTDDAYAQLIQNYSSEQLKKLIDIHTLLKSHEEKNSQIQPSLYLVIAGITTGIIGLQGFQCYLNYYVNRMIVLDFMQNWYINRAYTPHEFHHIFDALSLIIDMHGKEAVLYYANDIVEIMQFVIMRHFNNRYDKALQIQAINHLNDTKLILDVIKPSLDIYTTLKA